MSTRTIKAMTAVTLGVCVGAGFLVWYPFLFSLAWPGLVLARLGVAHSWSFAAATMIGLLVWLGLRSRDRTWWQVTLLSVVIPGAYCAFAFLYIARLPVPLPKATPYDTMLVQRSVYLESFDAGYRDGMAGLFRTYCFRPEVESRGFYEGSYHGSVVWYRLLGLRMPDREKRLIEVTAARDGTRVELMNRTGQPGSAAIQSQPSGLETNQPSRAGGSGR